MELKINFKKGIDNKREPKKYQLPIKEKLFSLFLKATTAIGFLGGGAMTFAFAMERLANFEMAIVAGTFWVIGGLSRSAYLGLQRKQHELELINLMLHNNGTISIPEAAINLNISTQKTDKLFDHMQAKDFLVLNVNEEGNIQYTLNHLDQNKRIS